ncbi:hypothetical protein VQL36_17510 [Chengkuizengella sp. SCS-71B]|uniref:hypothetical protein n=1 Tax=Chengkuizengella sp. SCS-71B TaxID=3115290 RepID=UPI0032C246AE
MEVTSGDIESTNNVVNRRDGYLYEKKSDLRAIGKIGTGEYNIEKSFIRKYYFKII